MTKSIRVENADTSDHPVRVEVWEEGPAGEPHILVSSHQISHPTAMVDLTIWDGRYLVIKEK